MLEQSVLSVPVISVNERLPEIHEHSWRTPKPVPVFVDGHGLTYAYLIKISTGKGKYDTAHTLAWVESAKYGNNDGEMAPTRTFEYGDDQSTEILQGVTAWLEITI